MKVSLPHSDPSVYIVGLGSQYPPYILPSSKLGEITSTLHNVSESSSLQKLLHINSRTGIETRSSISPFNTFTSNSSPPTTISTLDRLFRQEGVALARQACETALTEWGGSRTEITHTIAVTCTNQGNPGYDVLVNDQLGLPPTVQRTLLHGVGCAGGGAILRVAAQTASGESARGRPARVLAYACELCTPLMRHELAVAAGSSAEYVEIAAALFSDAAAAFVLVNSIALEEPVKEPVYEVMDWACHTTPETMGELTAFADPMGLQTKISKSLPLRVSGAVECLFRKLVQPGAGKQSTLLGPEDFEWAIHPGGKAVINKVKDVMGLSEHQLRASLEIYRTRGNSSSPTVLVVLDLLRKMGEGRVNVVAAAFGPGVTAEMALLHRY